MSERKSISDSMVEEGARWFAGMRELPDGPAEPITDSDRAYSRSFLEAVIGSEEAAILQHPDVQAAFASEEMRRTYIAFARSLNEVPDA